MGDMYRYRASEWNHCTLVSIDVQCHTLDGQPFEIEVTSAILPRLRRLLEAFRAASRPIVHIIRCYLPDGSNVELSIELKFSKHPHALTLLATRTL